MGTTYGRHTTNNQGVGRINLEGTQLWIGTTRLEQSDQKPEESRTRRMDSS